MQEDIFAKIGGIQSKCEALISENNLEAAKELLLKYHEDIPVDVKSQLLESLIYLEESDIERAKRSIVLGLNRSLRNYDLNYNLDLARQYEDQKEYLRAIEMYERVLAQVENINIKKELLEIIDNLEMNYFNEIKSQLNKQLQEIRTVPNVHLLIDTIYSKRFIEYVNAQFNQEEHMFLVLVEQEDLKYLNPNQYLNVKVIYLKAGWEKCMEINYEQILRYIHSSDKVFIHFLTDFISWFLCRFNIQQDIYWIPWGADVYSFIDIQLYDELTHDFLRKKGIFIPDYTGSIQERYNKAAIRRIKYILSAFPEEYNLIKDYYTINSKYIPFIYPDQINIPFLDNIKNIKRQGNKLFSNKYTILLGNSGDPTNNHVDMLYKLKELNFKDFTVIVPLTYGPKDYIKEIVDLGKELLGEQFVPLTEHLPSAEYFTLLNLVDIAIMNHNRQQALGNIFVLLYLGKKIYIKEHTTTYLSLINQGFCLFNVSEIPNQDIEKIFYLDDDIQTNNRDRILEIYNGDAVKTYFQEILNI